MGADSASLFFDQDLITGALSQKNIDALHLLEDGDLLLSVSISNGMPGGEKLAREDIVQ